MRVIIIWIARRANTSNVVDFTVADHQSSRLWSGCVRFNEDSYSSPPAREALSTYGFWLDLKEFIGSGKPALDCNDINLLRHYHQLYREQTYKQEDPWPFGIRIT